MMMMMMMKMLMRKLLMRGNQSRCYVHQGSAFKEAGLKNRLLPPALSSGRPCTHCGGMSSLAARRRIGTDLV